MAFPFPSMRVGPPCTTCGPSYPVTIVDVIITERRNLSCHGFLKKTSPKSSMTSKRPTDFQSLLI